MTTLAKLRQDYGFTQGEMAMHLGMARPNYIIHEQRNGRKLPLPELKIFARMIELEPIELYEKIINNQL